VDPAVALADLASGDVERLNKASVSISAAFRDNYTRYSSVDRRLLLDGLERIARGESLTDELGRTRALTTAFAILVTIAMDSTTIPEDREIPTRVLRIYSQADRLDSKALSVSSLGAFLPRFPSERAAIEALLFSVAIAPFAARAVPPQTAIDALLTAGAPGISVLRRLHEENAVKDPGAAAFLREIAKRGYTRG
jgi:hypothetical protein